MANEYFTASGNPATRATATSASMRAEFAAIVAGFDKLPTMTGNGGKLLVVNSAGTALAASSTIYEVSGKIGIATATPGTALGFVNGAQISWGASNYAYVSGSNATNVLTFGTQATERMRIDASGNVGVGLTSPTNKLDVNGTVGFWASGTQIGSAFNDSLALNLQANNNATSGLKLGTSGSTPIVAYTNGSERMRIDASGNVGIGLSPNAWGSGRRALEVGNNTTINYINGAGTTTRFGNNYFFNGTNTAYVNSGAAHYYEQASTGHVFYTAGSGTAGATITWTQAMTLDASGNLGLGVTPVSIGGANATVHVHGITGSNPNLRLTNADTGATASDGSAIFVGNAGGAGASSLNIYNYESAPIAFYTATAERMRIDSAGNLKIGNATTMSGTGSDGITAMSVSPGSACTVVVQNNSGPNYYASKVSGYSNNQFMSFNVNGTNVGLITTNGTTTTYATSSDARLKQNVAPAQDSGSVIDAVEVVSYEWKSGGAKVNHGVIAQQLYNVFPDAVVKGNDGEEITDPWGVDLSHMIPLLIKELQTLRARVANLEAA